MPASARRYTKHLNKLNDKTAWFIDSEVMKLKSVLGEEYPVRLTLPEQGSFDLGYYHQKQWFYTKKEDR